MERYRRKVTRKGQVTVPVSIRRQLNLGVGDNVVFVVERNEVKLEVEDDWATRTAGMFKGRGPALSAEELDAAIDDAWAAEAAERDERSKQR